MKKLLLIIPLFTFFLSSFEAKSQPVDSIDFYMLTCEPGREAYSVYGHSAIRVVVHGIKSDIVYNWGLFDFETPHFAFRFAKGKLNYMIGACRMDTFMREYEMEGRTVWSQKINLTNDEKITLIRLLNNNIRPENAFYRYNFFYDNCATRVRDIIEKSMTGTVSYPVEENEKTFRELIHEYQKQLPWLDFGADFLLGLPADKKASVRDEAFLPILLMHELGGAIVNRSGKCEPVLSAPVVLLDMSNIAKEKPNQWIIYIVFYSILVLIVLITFVFGVPIMGKVSDWIIFSAYSLLSILMVFFNFFSDHQATHYNLLILAFNPLLPVILYFILMAKKFRKLARIALSLALIYFPAALIIGQDINPAVVPLIIIMMIRLFKHSEFGKL
jgi:hypothetical protein